MKKKYLSLITGIISGLVATALFATMIVCIFRINRVSEVIQDTTDELSGLNLIAYAGVGYFLSILGIIISGALTGYRVMMTYYYIKIFLSDEKFYDERRKGIFGFAALSLIMFLALSTAYFLLRGVIDIAWIVTANLCFMIAYGLLVFLPIIEIVLVSALKPKKKEKKEKATNLSKAKISEELNKQADDAAESEAVDKSQKTEDKNV